jgi:hypothetical protein
MHNRAHRLKKRLAIEEMPIKSEPCSVYVSCFQTMCRLSSVAANCSSAQEGKMVRAVIGMVALALPVAALSAQDDDIEPFELEVAGDQFIATGTLVPNSGAVIDQARRADADIRVMVMLNVPGSDDENDYLDAGRKLRRDNFVTVVPSNGLVASGGTDFFLSGSYRIVEPGACLGVHSWEEVGPPAYEARSVPRDHEDHFDWLAYFQDMGISQEFYWFTIYAASATNMHWMSPEEINRFGLSSVPVPENDGETAAMRAARCEARAENF